MELWLLSVARNKLKGGSDSVRGGIRKSAEEALADLEQRVSKLETTNSILWELLKAKPGYSDAEISAAIQRANDAAAPARCPQCGRAILSAHSAECQWCGASLLSDSGLA